MEAKTSGIEAPAAPAPATGRRGRPSPAQITAGVIVLIALLLLIGYGAQDLGQRTINGVVAGTYFALGAVGLTLVYGTLKLVNFAHGDMLTFGAYIAFMVNITLGAPIVLAVLAAVAATAALGIASERVMWRPMRAKGAGLLQMLLIAIGFAFVIRYSVQFVAGTEPRNLDVDATASVAFIGLRIGRTQLIVVVVGLLVLLAIGLMLQRTLLGKQMRALSDNFDLSEVTGINTDRIVFATWIFSAGLAGLAGVLLVMAVGTMTINIGFFVLLSLFAAVILGGIGNAYGALAGGLVIGLAQEWSTLLLDARWKVAVSFGILILVLTIRPDGLFGKARTI
jgi:neutral amino acid transport system permease protein